MSSDFLKITNLSKTFGSFTAVNEVSFSLAKGEAFALLGESGCGKTTLLRSIAGLENPCRGVIQLDGCKLFDSKVLVPPNKRNIGIVFQDYALFPHKNVADNITFGIEKHPEKKHILDKMLQLFRIEDQRAKMPSQLSGGQLQRVATARTLAFSPALVLLDEPFSNLDKQLALELRHEIREIFRKEELSSILVTHDQQEAYACADRIAVMKRGQLLQIDTGEELYCHPNSIEVAEFLGNRQFITGHAQGEKATTPIGEVRLSQPRQGAVKILLHPESLELQPDEQGEYTVEVNSFMGSFRAITLKKEGTRLNAQVPHFCHLPTGCKVALKVPRPVLAFEV
jgi:iron(III) transport system ATP-binding protein